MSISFGTFIYIKVNVTPMTKILVVVPLNATDCIQKISRIGLIVSPEVRFEVPKL